jgi:hypothetical protein
MQVIAVNRAVSLANRLAIARSIVVAGLLLMAGVSLGWLCLGTPVMSGFIPDGRPSLVEIASGILVWGFAVVVPAALLILGLARFVSVADTLTGSRQQRMTAQLARALGPDHLAATDLVLPGGRRLHEMVLGPFGIAVLGDVPPRSVTRHAGAHWEARDARGRWIPIENPVQRATRDAERVRSWLASNDRDVLVRVYAVIATDDPTIERSSDCAVVATSELASWLEALPGQRGLTPGRREHLEELVRTLAATEAR